MARRRCIKCRTSAMPGHDLCLMCSHAELAAQARRLIRRKKPGPAKRAKQNRMPCVSVAAEAYETWMAKAHAQGMTMTALVEAALKGFV